MGFFKSIGHALSKPLGIAERIGGAGLGLVTGGPMGAVAGYKAGDALANTTEDALQGHNVAASIGRNAIPGVLGAAGAYGASRMPNTGGIMNFGRSGPSGGIPPFPGSGMPMPDLSAVPGAIDQIGQNAGAGMSTLDKFKSGLGTAFGVGKALTGQGGGNGSAFDWAKLGIDTLGGAAAGAQSAKTAADLLKERQAEFGRTQGQSEGQDAFRYQQSVNSSPLRDQAQYLLMQRMGMVPQAFRPHDIYNESYGSGPAQLGGIDPQALQQANNRYTPGAGGVKTDVEKALLARFGFMPQPQQATGR